MSPINFCQSISSVLILPSFNYLARSYQLVLVTWSRSCRTYKRILKTLSLFVIPICSKAHNDSINSYLFSKFILAVIHILIFYIKVIWFFNLFIFFRIIFMWWCWFFQKTKITTLVLLFLHHFHFVNSITLKKLQSFDYFHYS